MTITVNGKKDTLSGPKSLLEFINEKKLAKERVIVELNLEIIPRPDLAETQIQEGDSIEIISFIGGGK